MKLTINENVSIEISDPSDLFEMMSSEEKSELIESLSCQDEVIKHVADQIIHGCTENGRHGWLSGGAAPSTPLSVAVREIVMASSDLARKEIESLERMVEIANKRNDELWDRIRKLERTS